MNGPGGITTMKVSLACAMAVFGLVFAAPSAGAEELLPVPETGGPGVLSLSSSVYPLMFPRLEQAESFSWQLGVTLGGKPSATASLQLTAGGTLAGDYRVSVHECPQPWLGASGRNQILSCPAQDVPRMDATLLNDVGPDARIPIGQLRPGAPSYLRFTLDRPSGAEADDAGVLTLGIGVTAGGEDDGAAQGSQPVVGSLGHTGADVSTAAFAGTSLLLLGGAVFAALRRRKGEG